jgi:hypothetical protein
MRRAIGTFLVFLGCVLLALDGLPWDSVVADVPGPGAHGIHASDPLGFAFAAFGVVALLMGGPRR